MTEYKSFYSRMACEHHILGKVLAYPTTIILIPRNQEEKSGGEIIYWLYFKYKKYVGSVSSILIVVSISGQQRLQ
jgi:hypothetical protein